MEFAAAAAVGAGWGLGAPEACEEAEVVLAAVLAVPLVLTALTELLAGGERLVVDEVACEATEVVDWLDERRVEPTSLRNCLFMEEVMDSLPALQMRRASSGADSRGGVCAEGTLRSGLPKHSRPGGESRAGWTSQVGRKWCSGSSSSEW